MKFKPARTTVVLVPILLVYNSALVAQGPVDFCRILSDCSAYQGRLVTTEGSFVSGIVTSTKCPLRWFDGVRVPRSIELRVSGSEPDSEPLAHFRTDRESQKRLSNFLGHTNLARSEVRVRLSGEVRCAVNYKLEETDRGEVFGNGYGMFGMLSAMLVVKEYLEFSASPRGHKVNDSLPSSHPPPPPAQ